MLDSLVIPPYLQTILDHIYRCGGSAILVGGAVRDLFLGLPSKDFDIEVYYLEEKKLVSILKQYGKINFVGKSFGIMLMVIDGFEIDFAIPRKEKKIEEGHRGFEVNCDPYLSFEVASSRRDFTLNAMGIDLKTKKLLDPHQGFQDLQQRKLKHVSDAFGEDPLRALRAIQFAARFELSIESETQEICSKQPLNELPAERIYEEFKKLLLKSKKPSIGMEWMRKMNLLKFFPELKALIGVKQDPEWHPEGDVWTHNNMVLDQAALIRDQEISNGIDNASFHKMVLMLGALCHDFGKSKTTVFVNGRWRSPAHDIKGVPVAVSFLKRMTRDQKLISAVIDLVKEHLRPMSLYLDKDCLTGGAINRLALRVDIPALVRVAKADYFGRTTVEALGKSFLAGNWLIEQYKKLGLHRELPKPLLTGKILKSYGFSPGPKMGKIIRESFEFQLEGQIKNKEDLTNWLKTYYINK